MDKIVYKLVYNRKKRLNRQGVALVQIEAYLARKKKYFSTQVYLKPTQWDARRAMVKRHPNADDLNHLMHRQMERMEKTELELRRRFNYPPFSHMAVLTVRSVQEELARFGIESLHRRLEQALPPTVQLSPPIPSPIAKSYGQYRYQCTLCAPGARVIAEIGSREIQAMGFGEDIIATLDIDAYTFS